MGDVVIRDFPDVLKERLVRRAMRNNRNFSEEAVALISDRLAGEDLLKAVEGENAYEAIRTAFGRDILSDDFADLMQELERGRKLRESLAGDEQPRPVENENAYEAIRRAFVENDALMSDEEHAQFMADVDEMRRSPGRRSSGS